MNKTLNEPQDLIKNAKTGHGTVEDLEGIVKLKRPWHSRVECEGGSVYIGLDLTIGEDLKLFGYMGNVRFI